MARGTFLLWQSSSFDRLEKQPGAVELSSNLWWLWPAFSMLAPLSLSFTSELLCSLISAFGTSTSLPISASTCENESESILLLNWTFKIPY